MTNPISRRAAAWSAALLAGLFAFLAASTAAEADAVGARAKAVATPRFERGLLWRVEWRGAPAGYLFGTLHHDDERATALPAPVRRALARSKVLAVEMINDEVSVRSFRAAMLSRETRLPALIDAADYERVEAVLRDKGVPRDARAHLKPWAALLILLQPRESPGIIVDNLLQMEAVRAGKRIEPLETVAEQIAAFDGMPQPTQLALLRHAAADYDRIQDAVRPLLAAYLERDLGQMWRVNAQAMAGDPEIGPHNEVFLERLLFERSRRFAQRLAPLLRQGGVFAAFGALHLHGERGVPALLEREGFRLRRLD